MKIDRWKTFWVIALAGFFGGSVALVFTGDETGSASAGEQTAQAASEAKEGAESKASAAKTADEEPAHEPVIEKTAEGCLADSATLEDLRRQKIELEAKQKEIAAREAELKAREQALNDEMKKLASARDEIEKIDQSRKKENDGKIAKLVETVESMNPKASAQLLGSLDEALATATMARLSTAKLAKVMNVMDPSRSTRLSELLAGVARAKTRSASHDAAGASIERAQAGSDRASNPAKGGDTNDGKSHDQASSRTTADGDASAQRRGPSSASR